MKNTTTIAASVVAAAGLITVGLTYLVLTTLVTQVTAAIEYRFDVEGRQK